VLAGINGKQAESLSIALQEYRFFAMGKSAITRCLFDHFERKKYAEQVFFSLWNQKSAYFLRAWLLFCAVLSTALLLRSIRSLICGRAITDAAG
jgi:hypothetical protein